MILVVEYVSVVEILISCGGDSLLLSNIQE